MEKLAVILIGLALSGCTTLGEIKRPDGSTEYIIGCGAGTGWNVCYDRANEVCPTGYTTIKEEGGFNRKELYIGCPKNNKISP